MLPLSSDRHFLSLTFLQVEDDKTAEPLKSVFNLSRMPSTPFDLVKRLYHEELLPSMKNTHEPFMKVSRKKYNFLANSILANVKGEIFEQYHFKDRNALIGSGAYKRVWELKSLCSNSEMVRSRFHWTLSRSQALKKQMKKIVKLKNEVICDFLMIPESTTYFSSRGLQAIVQMMPKAMGGDLSKAAHLSYVGKLRVIYQLGFVLLSMHEKKWVHLDVKPHNILLINQNPDQPISQVSDLDFIRKFKENIPSYYYLGTPNYMDPKCLNHHASGLEDAKIHDQFSFGATLYETLTGHVLRKFFKQESLKAWVIEEDLHASSKFCKLNLKIQNLIRKCCLGSSEIRRYRLPKFIKILNEIISEIT